MPHRPPLPYARNTKRPTWNYQQVMEYLGCSKRHVYNLYDRSEITGYFIGNGRGLRIYIDSVDDYKRRKEDPNI